MTTTGGSANSSSFFSCSAAKALVAKAKVKATARPTPSPAARAIFWRILLLRLSLARFCCRLMSSPKFELVFFAGWHESPHMLAGLSLLIYLVKINLPFRVIRKLYSFA